MVTVIAEVQRTTRGVDVVVVVVVIVIVIVVVEEVVVIVVVVIVVVAEVIPVEVGEGSKRLGQERDGTRRSIP